MAPVDELEELDRELDVSDPTAPAFQLPVVQPTSVRLTFGPGLHRANGPNRVRPEDIGPHERFDQLA